MRITRAMLDAKLAILAKHYPTAPGHTLVLLAGSPTYGRPWSLAERNDDGGGLHRVVRLGATKENTACTLDAMVYCFNR